MAESKYYGIYQGIVTNISDTEKRGRLKVKCPDVLADTESAWCDPMIPVAYDNGGDFCMPQKEEAVWVMFIGGDSNKPVWLGGWWQKNMTPLGSSYSDIDKVRIISYADCTITLKDGKITINVGEGSGDLIIEDGKISVKGSLSVSGSITAGSLSAGSVDAKIWVNEETGSATTGNIKAEGTVHGTNI